MIMSDWIDVNERLPNDLQQVLIAHCEGGVMQAQYEERYPRDKPHEYRFLTPYGNEIYDVKTKYPAITHWMPLPVSPIVQAYRENKGNQL